MESSVIKILAIIALAVAAISPARADVKVRDIVVENKVRVLSDSVKGDTVSAKVLSQLTDVSQPEREKRVIVGKDTVSIIIPEKNWGRYDRGLFNYLFIPRGQWSFGITASYGEFNAEDVRLLSFLKDLDFKGTVFSVNPYVSYFFRHNESVGMKFGYTRNKFDLGSLSVDIDDDLNFSLKNVLYHTESYSASLFYRHYVGLDNNRRFAVFNEVDLSFGSGTGRFVRSYNDVPKDTRTTTTEAKLNFSPGLCVFVQDYVSFNISFGVFGLYFKKENQKTDDTEEGSRFSSGANFKFNLFNLSMGIAVHI